MIRRTKSAPELAEQAARLQALAWSRASREVSRLCLTGVDPGPYVDGVVSNRIPEHAARRIRRALYGAVPAAIRAAERRRPKGVKSSHWRQDIRAWRDRVLYAGFEL